MSDYLGVGEHDIPADQYHGDPCETPSLSASLAALLVDGTPAHAWEASPRLNPNYEPTTASHFDLGTAAHEVLLGKGQGIYVVDADSWRTKAAKEEQERARSEGLTPLLRKDADRVENMVGSAIVQLKERGLWDTFEKAAPERTLIWESGGVMNRCMVDKIDHENRIAWDLKTTSGMADPDLWLNRDMGHGVDIRAAHYLDGLTAVHGPGWRYRFLVVETKPPHLIAPPIELTEHTLHIGREKLALARSRWAASLADDKWPGWPEGIVRLEPRIFHETRWEEQKAELKSDPSKAALQASYELMKPHTAAE